MTPPLPVRTFVIAAIMLNLLLAGCGRIDGDWPNHGRTFGEDRFSPLEDISDTTVDRLKLAWYSDLDSNRGQEATPIEIDGVLYTSTAWSIAKAFDATTGALLWSFDPQVPKEWGVNACCDVAIAASRYGRTRSLSEPSTAALSLSTRKRVNKSGPRSRSIPPTYTITGAPRIVKGKVVIGNGGAEYGVRGYVSAYDAESGKLAWRFYTVPGDPSKPFEAPILAKAAKTWAGQYWRLGGGGTVWDSMAYDPDLDLLYIGTGNGSPWNRKDRSDGKGDNLFLSSIIALRPDTGEYVWHYQTTPGDEWDFTATQHMILADLNIAGQPRKVLMQAPKNGFFYVIDRITGKLLSAKPFIPVNWASGIDMKTGRPIENPAARYSETGKPFMQMPGALGAHSWYPMSFSPKTGLVYFPAQTPGMVYTPTGPIKINKNGWNTGVDLSPIPLPDDPKVLAAIRSNLTGALIAWDPVQQKEKWRVNYGEAFNGGTLVTAGNLVFQGTASGHLFAYKADTGAKLWSFDAHSPITAPPISYSVKGVQYVAVMVGYGGAVGMGPGAIVNADGAKRNISRLLVFRLDGTASLPPAPPKPAPMAANPPADGVAASTEAGRRLFERSCAVCHGTGAVSAGVVPDLRYSQALNKEAFSAIVSDGALAANGMVSFGDTLSPTEVEQVRAFVVMRARATMVAAKP